MICIDARRNTCSVENNNAQISRIKRFYSLLILTAPILNQYMFLSLTYLEMISIIGTIGLILKRQRKLRLEEYAQFNIWGFLTSMVATAVLFFSINKFDTSIATFVIRMVKYIFYFTGFVVAGTEFFDVTYARKAYTNIVKIVVVAFMIQYIASKMLGLNLYLIIPNIPLNYNDGINSSDLISNSLAKISSGYYFRPSSFFLEPAYYALYVVPWLALTLFGAQPPKYLGTIVASGSVLLTTSSLGLIGVLLVWGIYICYYTKLMQKDIKKLVAIPFAVVVISIVINYVMSDNSFITSINIKLKSASQLMVASSLTVRLFRGALYYDKLGFLQKIIGVGYGNISQYYDASNMYLIYDANLTEKAYMSGLFTILNTFGIFGFILYIKWIVSVWKQHDKCKRVILLVLMAFLCSSACYETASYWIIILFLLNLY